MKPDLLIKPYYSSNNTPVLIPVVQNLPLGMHSIDIMCLNEGGTDAHQHTFFGTGFTVQFENIPLAVNITVDGLRAITMSRHDIAYYATKTKLLYFTKKLLHNHRITIQYKT